MTSLYLSGNRLQAVSGSGGGTEAVIKKHAIDVDIGAFMFNGGIVDEDGFCAAVTRLFSENKLSKRGVTLVLGGTQVVTRIIKAPSMGREATLEYVANELTDVERAETPVYAYSVLGRGGGGKPGRLLALEADEQLINRYVELFRRCRIKLAAVQHYVPCAVRSLKGTGLEEKSFIMIVMEERGFTSFLFVGGEYTYSTYTRIMSSHGSPEFGSEIARAVSMIMQSVRAQRIGEDIRELYLAGFSEEDAQIASEVIERMGAGLSCVPMPGSKRIKIKTPELTLGGCIYAAGGMLMEEQSAGLLRNRRKDSQRRRRRRRVIVGTVVIVIVAALLTGGALYLKHERDTRRARLSALNAYNNAESTINDVQYSQELFAAVTDLNTRSAALDKAQEIIDGYPLPNESVRREVMRCAADLAEVEILAYDASTGELWVETTAEEVDNIHLFIAKLEKSDIVQVLDYSGYSYVEREQLWSIAIKVLLAPESGR